jgi:hypothetical protein
VAARGSKPPKNAVRGVYYHKQRKRWELRFFQGGRQRSEYHKTKAAAKERAAALEEQFEAEPQPPPPGAGTGGWPELLLRAGYQAEAKGDYVGVAKIADVALKHPPPRQENPCKGMSREKLLQLAVELSAGQLAHATSSETEGSPPPKTSP